MRFCRNLLRGRLTSTYSLPCRISWDSAFLLPNTLRYLRTVYHSVRSHVWTICNISLEPMCKLRCQLSQINYDPRDRVYNQENLCCVTASGGGVGHDQADLVRIDDEHGADGEGKNVLAVQCCLQEQAVLNNLPCMHACLLQTESFVCYLLFVILYTVSA
ncbi:hypothetical protein ACN38_g7549 [Penicillium nordicum]|uniref:Uncharacterized protein n=1 Tax=Penicillium nordicum TaxID=229535 RepID=A0A0M9WEA1_9EURO|nr:hypothetical protein ACN38_g7549 [Penicillium nordicum]